MEIKDIISEKEFKSFGSIDYDTFSKLVGKVVKLCVEESLKALPSVMTHLSSQAGYLKGLSGEFYSNNKDLIPHKKIMAQAIENVEGNNPGMSYDDILKEAAKSSREIISRLNQTVESKDKNVDLEKFDSHLGKL